jgi:hypothetical protein
MYKQIMVHTLIPNADADADPDATTDTNVGVDTQDSQMLTQTHN